MQSRSDKIKAIIGRETHISIDSFQFTGKIANPTEAVKVEMNGVFSANLDGPARFCLSVIKAGKPQGCLPASFGFWEGMAPS